MVVHGVQVSLDLVCNWRKSGVGDWRHLHWCACCNQFVVVKSELSVKLKLLIFWLIYVPTLPYGREIWVVTQKKWLLISAAFISNLQLVTLRDRMKRMAVWKRVSVQAVDYDTSWLALSWGDSSISNWEETQCNPKTCRRDYVSHLAVSHDITD